MRIAQLLVAAIAALALPAARAAAPDTAVTAASGILTPARVFASPDLAGPADCGFKRALRRTGLGSTSEAHKPLPELAHWLPTVWQQVERDRVAICELIEFQCLDRSQHVPDSVIVEHITLARLTHIQAT